MDWHGYVFLGKNRPISRDKPGERFFPGPTKALESTIKCICKEKGWAYPDHATAQPLFQVMVAHDLLDDWMENGFMGVVTIRNRATAHGQGTEPRPLPRHVAELAINLAASQIIALMSAAFG